MFQEVPCTGADRRELLHQKFPQYATDFVFFTDEKVFSVASPDNWQNKVSGRLQELPKKKLSVFFSVCVVCCCLATCQLCLCLATF